MTRRQRSSKLGDSAFCGTAPVIGSSVTPSPATGGVDDVPVEMLGSHADRQCVVVEHTLRYPCQTCCVRDIVLDRLH